MRRYAIAGILAGAVSAQAADEAPWGAVVLGQSTPSTDRVAYPYDVFGVAWNYPNPAGALDAAMDSCRNRGTNCARGGRANAFSTSAAGTAQGGEKARCVAIFITTSRVMTLRSVTTFFTAGEMDIPSAWNGVRTVHFHRTYCNAR